MIQLAVQTFSFWNIGNLRKWIRVTKHIVPKQERRENKEEKHHNLFNDNTIILNLHLTIRYCYYPKK